jgi:RNA polymerase sigma-70 factor (ECF subfamily)
MSHPTDDVLIRRTLEGDQTAFADLVRRYQRRVAATVRSVLGEMSREDLADVTQEIFIIVFRSLGSFRGDSQFGTYLTRIALRHCYRESKRRKNRRSLFSPFDSSSPGEESPESRLRAVGGATDRPVVAEERRRAVVEALQRLPEEFRTVLVLRIVEEMPVEEVAEALGVSTGTVKSRLHRAKEKMRELLEGEELEFQIDE